jgi:hypothetical protein
LFLWSPLDENNFKLKFRKGRDSNYRLALFDAKKTKQDWISTHKEGRLDIFDRVVFLVEMGWSSNSRNAV